MPTHIPTCDVEVFLQETEYFADEIVFIDKIDDVTQEFPFAVKVIALEREDYIFTFDDNLIRDKVYKEMVSILVDSYNRTGEK